MAKIQCKAKTGITYGNSQKLEQYCLASPQRHPHRGRVLRSRSSPDLHCFEGAFAIMSIQRAEIGYAQLKRSNRKGSRRGRWLDISHTRVKDSFQALELGRGSGIRTPKA